MNPRVVQPRVDYDAAHGDVPVCWVCRQHWPHALSLILDALNRELRIDGAAPIAVKPSEAEVLAVLINVFPRWISRAQLVEYAYAERPDVDMPTAAAAGAALTKLRQKLDGTRYVIQSDLHQGVRLVTEEILARERAEYLAQIPNTGMRQRQALANASAGAIERAKKLGAKVHKKRPTSKKHPQGISKRSTKAGTPKIAQGNVYHRKPRKLDV